MLSQQRRHTLALVSILLGAFISLLDTTIVNVALPDISKSLDASSASIEWVVSGYALAFGIILILAGRLGDRFGRKNLYLVGISIFLLMSVTAGFSTTESALVISRVIQGLAAGLFFPQINAMIMDLYHGKQLSKIFGLLGSVIGVATAVGPLTGGLLIALFGKDYGWRWVFFVNVPFVLITIILAVLFIPKSSAPKTKIAFDFLGILLLTVALVLLLFPLIASGSSGFSLIEIVLMALSIPLFIILYIWSRHLEKANKLPLISPQLLKNNQFVSGMLLSLVYFAAFTSIFFVLSITWQTGFDRSAIISGLAVSPFAFGSLLAASNSYRFIPKLGRYLLVIGILLVVIGLIAVSIIFAIQNGAFSAWLTALPLFIAGIGSGLVISPLNSFTLSTVSNTERGGASGMFNTAQRIGSSFGIAVVGSVFFKTFAINKGEALAKAYSASLQMSMYVNIALLAICILLVFRLPKVIK